MDTTSNSINWFEIYVDDLARAKTFYETIFDIRMNEMDMGDMKMVVFPMEQDARGLVGGALIRHDMRRPSDQGTLIYLNANPDLSPVLSRIEAAGGKVTMSKTKISDDIGYMAFFIDSEGNGLALHSLK